MAKLTPYWGGLGGQKKRALQARLRGEQLTLGLEGPVTCDPWMSLVCPISSRLSSDQERIFGSTFVVGGLHGMLMDPARDLPPSLLDGLQPSSTGRHISLTGQRFQLGAARGQPGRAQDAGASGQGVGGGREGRAVAAGQGLAQGREVLLPLLEEALDHLG